MTDPAGSDKESDENVLFSAFSTAFSPGQVTRQSAVTDEQLQTSLPIIEPAQQFVEPMPSSSDSWKTQYDAQVQKWRTQSALAREKAEKERARWEEVRATQKEATGKEPTAADGQREHPQNPAFESVEPPLPLERRDTTDDMKLSGSQKWEEIPSTISSLPSMSFPERSGTTSPDPHRSSEPLPVQPPQRRPQTMTLAIFDTSLPVGRRVVALFSSLAINLLLPFVNGVMLGFGEIFAKNVILRWFGWNRNGSAAAAVGIRKPSRKN